MLLKRVLVLAAGVLLFLAVFIVYRVFADAQREGRFHDERVRFGVEGSTLTSSAPALSSAAAAPEPSFQTNALIGPVPPASTDTTAAPVPAATSDTTATPSDTNSAPAAPDTSPPTPASAPADSNAAPATPAAPSTMNSPALNHPSVFQFASYRPFAGAEVRLVAATMGQTASGTNTPAAVPASTGEPAASTPAAAPATVPGASSTGSVIVLLYHQFRPAGVPINPKYLWTMHQDVFESEIKYIHDNGYNVIPMSDLLKFLRHEGTVPPHAVVITIDDGYKSAIVYAAPILKKYGYPWTFFIYPDFITVAEGSGAASWNDLVELQSEGIDIESHSMTHPNLKLHKQKIKGVWKSLSPDEYADWLKNETAGAKEVLEQHLNKKIVCFAYPYGEYNTQVEKAAIDAGYEAIFTVADNPVHASTPLHSIGRYTITQLTERDFPAYLRQGALGLASADPAPGTTTSDPRPVITAVLGYAGKLDPKSIETQVLDFGYVRHDFDPATNTIRLYLPRDLVASVVRVSISVRDAATGQVMVANWHFNYEPAAGAATALESTEKPSMSSSNAPATAPEAPKNPVDNTATPAPAQAAAH